MRLAYSTRLQSTLAEIQPPLKTNPVSTWDGGALFFIALFGFDALKGTPDAAFAKAFGRSSGDGSGCGGGCGGDGGGGGGCGGAFFD